MSEVVRCDNCGRDISEYDRLTIKCEYQNGRIDFCSLHCAAEWFAREEARYEAGNKEQAEALSFVKDG